MAALPDSSLLELSMMKKIDNYKEPTGLSGIDSEKIKLLKVDLLTYSESVKKLLLRLEQCKTTLGESIQGKSRETLLQKTIKAYDQLIIFNDNLNIYSDALGKAVTMYQDVDAEISENLTKDMAIIAGEKEVDNNANN